MPNAINIFDKMAEDFSGMNPRQIVFLYANEITVAKQTRSWERVAEWLFEKGCRPQRAEKVDPRVLACYLSAAKKAGKVDQRVVDELSNCVSGSKEALSKLKSAHRAHTATMLGLGSQANKNPAPEAQPKQTQTVSTQAPAKPLWIDFAPLTVAQQFDKMFNK